jgi:hypothetical protein
MPKPVDVNKIREDDKVVETVNKGGKAPADDPLGPYLEAWVGEVRPEDVQR